MTVFPLYGDKKEDDQTEDNEFHIGLVMAGAISAGAYTAGVMDFLIEAIRAWEKAKTENTPGTPTHSVQFDVIAGASAGGMCGGIFASALRNYQPGVTSPEPDDDSNNTFYRSWVLEVDYKGMITTDDLIKGEAPKSVLNVEGKDSLEGIRDRALDVTAPVGADWPKWLRDPLPIVLSINNLKGVTYSLGFNAPGSGATHGMSMHQDFMLFSLSDNGTHKHEDALSLNYRTSGQGTNEWQVLGEALLATGAFPAAFQPLKLERDAGLYHRRLYWMQNDDLVSMGWRPIPPNLPQPGDAYAHYTVDGGTLNNEPMDIARKALADKTGRNERDAKKASRVLLMVDPFPNSVEFAADIEPHGTLTGSLSRLFGTFIAQARLKLEDVMLFGDETVASRFAIAPISAGEQGPLASSSLGAFGGILDVHWRHHDYLLGRLNCQKFLKEWFVVDPDNRLVQGKHPQLSALGKARIIPLVGGMGETDAAVEGLDASFVIPWPKAWPEDRAKDFSDSLFKRIKKVIMMQLRLSVGGGRVKSFFVRKYVSLGLSFVKKTIRKTIVENLRNHDLVE